MPISHPFRRLAAAALCLALLPACGGQPAAQPAGSGSASSAAGSASQPQPAVPVEALKIQEFPCKETAEFAALFQTMIQENPDATYRHPYEGLFQETVEAEGLDQPRQLFTYIPANAPHCASSVFVALPSGERPETFLVSSGWCDLADESGFLLHALAPNGETWGEEAAELTYLAAAFALGTKTINYSPYTGNYYFVGYGDGGRLLQQYVMSTPDNCAGMAILDGSEISASYLQQMRQTPAVNPDLTVSQIQAPVWIVERELSGQVQAVVDYWKAANRCGSAPLTVPDAPVGTQVFQENLLSAQAFVNDYPMGKVQVSVGTVAYTDQTFTRMLWEDFLSTTQRYRSLAGNDLRPAMDLQALGFTKEERVVDGYPRYWLEYVPQVLRDHPEREAPLVMALHGAGQCAEAYAPYSEWFKVAEEAGFIVVFPTAYPYAENGGMARPIHNDCWAPDRPDDISFWRQIIQDVSARHKVDAGRVYATGHSNGGNSSAMIAGEMSDVVTAVAISAGRYRNIEEKVTEDLATLHAMASVNPVPVIQLVGTNDGGAYQSPSLYSTMMYWLQRNGCQDLDSPLTYRTGLYHNQIWCDANGVPMVRFAVVEGKPHTTTPSESRLFWYEFLSHYARGEDGSVLYMQDGDIIRN